MGVTIPPKFSGDTSIVDDSAFEGPGGAGDSGIPIGKKRGGRVKAPAKKAPAKMKCGGKVSKMKCGGTVKKAAGGKVSGRDGIARKGRTSAKSC